MSPAHPATTKSPSPNRLLTSALGFALASTGAAAAENAANDTDVPARDKAANLEGMKVNSTVVNAASPKLTAPLLDTPRAITVVPSLVIRNTASTTLAEEIGRAHV